MKRLTESNIDALNQALDVLYELSDENYTRKYEIALSSVGQHIRHIVDHYIALRNGMEQKFVNYDIRNRNCDIETNRTNGITSIKNMIGWLDTHQHTDHSLKICSEHSLSDQQPLILNSFLSREFSHLLSHTLHHLAYIVLLVKQGGLYLADTIGMAPATVTWYRQNASRD